jgi:hypothetical protein
MRVSEFAAYCERLAAAAHDPAALAACVAELEGMQRVMAHAPLTPETHRWRAALRALLYVAQLLAPAPPPAQEAPQETHQGAPQEQEQVQEQEQGHETREKG